MDKAQGPDWSLLPNDPQAFFGLSMPFELVELKRAYGKLIKLYKPETNPGEFQRIRTAYERLERDFRYGLKSPTGKPADLGWANFAQRLAQAKPATQSPDKSGSVAAFRQLGQRSDKTPQDFFELAVLADLHQTEDKQAFLKYLILGLRAHPGDPALQQLIAGYLHDDLELSEAHTFLLALAKILPADIFFPLTEGLWLRLLRQPDFSRFLQLYEACNAQLQLGASSARQAFLLRALRIAAWKAEGDWLAAQLAQLEVQGPGSHRLDEKELVFLDRLLDFKKNFPANPSRVEQKIFEMVRDYCTLDWQAGANRVYACLSELARDVSGLTDSFQVSEDSVYYRNIFSICGFIAADIIDQTGGGEIFSSEKLVRQLAESTVTDLADDSAEVFARISRSWLGYNLIGWPLTVLGLPWFLGIFFPDDIRKFAMGIIFFLSFPLYQFVIKPKILEALWQRRLKQRLLAEYSRTWRPRLLRFVQACRAPLPQIMDELRRAGENLNHSQIINLVEPLSSYDPAIYFLNLAQRFTR